MTSMKKTLYTGLLAVFLIMMNGQVYAQAVDTNSTVSSAPLVPVGEDAYLKWDMLPYQRIGMRAYMRSTYDRDGNNRGADASHFLYQESDTFNVTLDVKGRGILYFARTNFFHGSPWHYETDGRDMIVKETGTDHPVNAHNILKSATFIPDSLFPHPLTYTWIQTKGADLMWRPIPFENTFRLAYGRTVYGTGYYIYHLFPKGKNNILTPIKSWDEKSPQSSVLTLLRQSGTDIAPKGKDVKTYTGQVRLKPFERIELCRLTGQASMIRAIKFKIPRNSDFDFGRCRLRVTWDDRALPSIDAPVDMFFGVGQLYNNDNREYLVKGFPLSIAYQPNSVHLSCYWPMPYFKSARIELLELSGKPLKDIHWEIRTEPYTGPANHVAYFHGTFTDLRYPEKGKDLNFLDTRTTEGGGEWSGHFVGMTWKFSETGTLGTLEGDPRFFFDNSKTPQAWGTGSEEWGGGGNYWGGENMTLPFVGHPLGKEAKKAANQLDLLNSAYRFLIADIFPFGNRAVINLEHGGTNQAVQAYSGVAYWYGVNSPTLTLTDQLNVSSKKSIASHNYISATASKPYALVSRYEWGADHDEEKNGEMYYPAEEDSVRTMTGTSQFTVALDKNNKGAMLRRKFDYAYPNQEAIVYVKAPGNGEWKLAGTWYTAGSNTCYYSWPRTKESNGFMTELEFAKPDPRIITSNRRWREEEFLIGEDFTKGLNKLEIKIDFVPNKKQLLPGTDYPFSSAWSESRYWVYSYVMPEISIN